TLGIPATEEMYANIIAQNYLREVEYEKKEGPVKHTVNVTKTYKFHWEDPYTVTDKCGTCGGSGNDPDNPTQDCPDCDGTGNEFCSKCDGTGKNPDDPAKSCPDCDGYRYETTIEYDQHSTSITVTKPYVIRRNYSYWTINRLEIHELEKAVVENGALNGGKVTVEVNDSEYCKPGVTFTQEGGIVSNPFDSIPKQNGVYTVTLPLRTINSEYHDESDIPDENLFNAANSQIGQFRVKNDSLKFDSNVNDSIQGITILSNAEHTANAPAPVSFPDIENTNKDVLYKENLMIPEKTPNGIYPTTVHVIYKRLANSINPIRSETIEREIPDINSVKIHTPVICNSGIWHDADHSQAAGGAITGCSDMALGREDKVRFKTDDLPENAEDTAEPMHLNIKGYMRNDYTKYTAKKYVQFPFDVYILDETGQKHPARGGEWVEVNKAHTQFNIELPVWVDEGEYTVKFKTVAINAPDDVINNPTIEGEQQKLANRDYENYVAYRNSTVRVVGQVYNFRITDMHDYPLWEPIFRVRTGSAVHTGKSFTVGGYTSPFDNWLLTGNQSIYNLPLMEGSHPNHENYGALKTGYGFKFELNTIGNYFNDNDSIRIKPSFWYVNKNGTGRTPVDIYYNERFDGKENIMVRIGSEKDKRNIKTVINTNIFRN
ncbi:MAG: hypothetical protein GX158_02465, partial [Bacteroidales bacterium]|nr:hypothetical protein [Bacteroidales bacterium]